jgi:hypothetical protein
LDTSIDHRTHDKTKQPTHGKASRVVYSGERIMKTQMLHQLENAIREVIENNADNDYWDEYIHDDIEMQMAKAAAMVFDASQAAQKFQRENTESMKTL